MFPSFIWPNITSGSGSAPAGDTRERAASTERCAARISGLRSRASRTRSWRRILSFSCCALYVDEAWRTQKTIAKQTDVFLFIESDRHIEVSAVTRHADACALDGHASA